MKGKTLRKWAGLALLLALCLAVPAGASTEGKLAEVSVRLLQEALKETPADRNVLLSPDSILSALAMAETGAAKETLKEMRAVLGGSQMPGYLQGLHQRLSGSKSFTYRPANAIWYKKGALTLKKSFLTKVRENYGAKGKGAPFDQTTVEEINAWVKKSTEGMIPSIVQRLEPEARVMLVNAIYLKAAWMDPYVRQQKRKFTRESGASSKVTMLESTEQAYVEIAGAKGFVKEYQGGQLAFMALLPPKGTSVRDYVKNLTGEELIQGYLGRKLEGIRVLTRLPAFDYDYEISLKEPLENLGIRLAFSEEADFSRMSKQGLCIDAVLHKTHIKVNKDGTEAAAATAIGMNATSAAPHLPVVQKKVYLNRPFVYAVVETKTGFPVFLGVVNNPK